MKINTGGHYVILEALEMRYKTGFIGAKTKERIDEVISFAVRTGKASQVTPFDHLPYNFHQVEHPDGWFYMAIRPSLWREIQHTDKLFDIKYLKNIHADDCYLATDQEVLFCRNFSEYVVRYIARPLKEESRQICVNVLFHDYNQRDTGNVFGGYLYDFNAQQKSISDDFGKWLNNPEHKKHYDAFWATSKDERSCFRNANFDWLGQYPNLRG